MRDVPSNSNNVIDSRDVIARMAELESAIADAEEAAAGDDPTSVSADYASERDELAALKALADEAEGYSDWQHGATLIRRSYFPSYAEDLAEDIHGNSLRQAEWPFSHINWEAAAAELEQDYTTVSFDGVDYLVRS